MTDPDRYCLFYQKKKVYEDHVTKPVKHDV